nr:Fur family transcriptional regulator [Ferrimicrobium acidiphilum]
MTLRESEDKRVVEVLAHLASSGHRITTARRHIVTALVGAGGHLTAEEVAAVVQAQDPSVHLATVYRTLEALERLGIVIHIHLGHGRAIYHLADSSHYHLYCQGCGSVQEIPQAEFDNLFAVVANSYGFKPSLGHFAIIGTCGRCMERKGSNGLSSDGSSPESIA